MTNLLFVGAFSLPFAGFFLRMALPQCVALALNYVLFLRLFRGDLPARFSGEALPDATSVILNKSYFRGAVAILGLVLIGYFAAPFVPLRPYAIGFAGCLALAVWGVRTGCVNWNLLRGVSWSVFPFIIGLFVVIGGIENLGLTGKCCVSAGAFAFSAAAAAGCGGRSRGGIEHRQQHPGGAAGADGFAAGARRGAFGIRRFAGNKHWPEHHGFRITRNASSADGRKEEKPENKSTRFPEDRPAGDTADPAGSSPDALALVLDQSVVQRPVSFPLRKPSGDWTCTVSGRTSGTRDGERTASPLW